MRRKLRYGRRALRDLEDIAEYTVEAWGNRQAVRYVAALRQRCRWLAQNLFLGMPRDEIRKGLRSFPQGRHIVFYSVSDDDVFIVGIPHSGMDLAAYFRRPA